MPKGKRHTEIDELDKKILELLNNNPRIRATEIGKKLGHPDTTIYLRMTWLKKHGYMPPANNMIIGGENQINIELKKALKKRLDEQDLCIHLLKNRIVRLEQKIDNTQRQGEVIPFRTDHQTRRT